MKRDIAIKTLLGVVNKEALIKTTDELAQQNPGNFSLQLLHKTLKQTDDLTNNWFTALGVLAINQALFTLYLLQKACILGGHAPMKSEVKRNLLNVIAQGAKLTKADAG